jgi:hypothetical protein
VARSNSFSTIEHILNENLLKIRDYLKNWYLTLNPKKTISITLYLNNRDVRRKLDPQIGNHNIMHEEHPKYLGVKLYRSLTFRQHLEDVKNKIKTRINIIQKLARTIWGADTMVLRSSAIALVYSVTEDCTTVWVRSFHCTKVDTELNQVMRIISRTTKPTQTQWLPLLANITSSDLRRNECINHILNFVNNNQHLPLFKDIMEYPPKRLKSRHPI